MKPRLFMRNHLWHCKEPSLYQPCGIGNTPQKAYKAMVIKRHEYNSYHSMLFDGRRTPWVVDSHPYLDKLTPQ